MNKRNYSIAFLFIFFVIVFLMGITYVLWRWVYTLNIYTSPFTTFWSYSLCLAEIITLIVFTHFSLILLRANDLEKITPENQLQNDYSKDVFKNGELLTFKNFSPSVAIFICTLNESVDMLSTTIAACKNIDYPNFKVYVLDDGRRSDVKELTEILECNYITRQTNKGYKAGNINNALSQTESDIVVIFDADHIPASTFLRETVYYFSDKDVALVQTPQHFCNPDAFQKNLELPEFLANEQDMFYRVIEPALNDFDSVFCGGTNILIERKKLESLGNFPENCITEDSLLGLKMHAFGYKVVYYNRPIAIGLSASSFEEYIKQRIRWAKGNVQIVANPLNWKYYAKLSPKQAFFYLSGVLYFFTPFARLIYLSAPVLFLFFDISPLLVLFYQVFAFQICYFTLKFSYIFAARIRTGNVVMADVYDLVTSIFTIGGILQALLIPEKLAKFKFSVTKKNLGKEKTNYGYKFPLIIIFLTLIAAEMQGIYDIMFSAPYSVLAVVANLFWNTINIIVLYYGIKVVSEKPEKREYQRIKASGNLVLDGKNKSYNTIIDDISRSGLEVTASEDIDNQELNVDIEGDKNELESLGCSKKQDNQYACKYKFKKVFKLERIAKIYAYRIVKFVKMVYKNPDRWDGFFNKKK